jgi:hypothetical protein
MELLIDFLSDLTFYFDQHIAYTLICFTYIIETYDPKSNFTKSHSIVVQCFSLAVFSLKNYFIVDFNIQKLRVTIALR